jgi:hypothetical protein
MSARSFAIVDAEAGSLLNALVQELNVVRAAPAARANDAVPPPASLEHVDQFFGSLKREGELFASSPARHWSSTVELASDLVWREGKSKK